MTSECRFYLLCASQALVLNLTLVLLLMMLSVICHKHPTLENTCFFHTAESTYLEARGRSIVDMSFTSIMERSPPPVYNNSGCLPRLMMCDTVSQMKIAATIREYLSEAVKSVR